MSELEIKALTNERGDERVVILERTDGSYTYRHQSFRDGWGGLGPICGIYDSAEMAESEARARTHWLNPFSN